MKKYKSKSKEELLADCEKLEHEYFILEQKYLSEKNKNKKFNDIEEALVKSFDSSGVGIALIDAQGNLKIVNKSAADILEFTVDELCQSTFMEITHPEDIENSVNRFQKCITDKKPYTIEKRYLTKFKNIKYGMTSITPVFKDNDFSYAIAHLQDVTDLKESKEALKVTEARLNAFFENSPVGLGLWDKEFKYVFVNDVLQKINGPSKEAHIGKRIREVLPKAADIIEPIFTDILKSGIAKNNIELSGELPSRPGEVSSFLVSYFPISTSNKNPDYIGGIIVDISDRIHAENELEKYKNELEGIVKSRTSELEKKNKELERLNNIFVGREFRIKELKDKLEALKRQ